MMLKQQFKMWLRVLYFAFLLVLLLMWTGTINGVFHFSYALGILATITYYTRQDMPKDRQIWLKRITYFPLVIFMFLLSLAFSSPLFCAEGIPSSSGSPAVDKLIEQRKDAANKPIFSLNDIAAAGSGIAVGSIAARGTKLILESSMPTHFRFGGAIVTTGMGVLGGIYRSQYRSGYISQKVENALLDVTKSSFLFTFIPYSSKKYLSKKYLFYFILFGVLFISMIYLQAPIYCEREKIDMHWTVKTITQVLKSSPVSHDIPLQELVNRHLYFHITCLCLTCIVLFNLTNIIITTVYYFYGSVIIEFFETHIFKKDNIILNVIKRSHQFRLKYYHIVIFFLLIGAWIMVLCLYIRLHFLNTHPLLF